MFVEQPLALPGSAKYREGVKTKFSKLKQVSRCNQDINLLNKGSRLLARKTMDKDSGTKGQKYKGTNGQRNNRTRVQLDSRA